MARLRLGVDVGGTFTDHILFDEEEGTLLTYKTHSTPDDPSKSVMAGIRHFVDIDDDSLRGLNLIAHGTTVNTNAILSRTGAKAALITTRGFRDVLAIGRQTRPDFYRWGLDRPEPLVPRYLRLEVSERINSQGDVIVSLDEEDLRRAVDQLRESDVQSVAVCLLNSYVNPIHEQRIKELLQIDLPEAYLAISSELSPEFREFERTSTATAVAYVGPGFQGYVSRLEKDIESKLDPAPRLYIMQSSGGMASARVEIDRPHLTLESGPAAGVLATMDLGRRLGLPNLISFDMGGTTAKASLIRNGKPSMVSMLEIGKEATGYYGIRITGLPVRAPSIDLVECSAGGGSTAWLDVAGLLKVGPQSAGAMPGPACYDLGGEDPTGTDANVILGRISPEFFLGGRMPLKVDLAHRAIAEKIAKGLGMAIEEAAQGILDVVNATMIRILRVVSVSRGFDPRSFTLVAHGGAGPLHACDVAQQLGISHIMIPPSPGLFSAMGLIISDIQTTSTVTKFFRVIPENLSKIRETLKEQEQRCSRTLEVEGVPCADRIIEGFLDIRYARQNFELEIPVTNGLNTLEDLEQVSNDFHEQHERAYGHCDGSASLEIVNVKSRGLGLIPKPDLAILNPGPKDPRAAFIGTKKTYFKEFDGWVDCPHYDRMKLSRDNVIIGPAMVCEFDSSIVISPQYRAVVGPLGELILDTD